MQYNFVKIRKINSDYFTTMDVMSRNTNKYGFSKYSERCRKQHFNEICLESNCEMKTCLRRHPKPCKFFEIYQKCKFGTFCAFKHCVSLQVKDIIHLKSKVENLEKENIEKTKEISVLIELVEQIFAEREEIFRAATKGPFIYPVIHFGGRGGSAILSQSYCGQGGGSNKTKNERILKLPPKLRVKPEVTP